ncbi:MAG TPA: hypothetical protein VMP01_14620 [Pirellulaceae bacterium]|nr:hypothetical protein [Pirellulaceae bacterium]
MHLHEYRLHPDWIARLEMFRQFASRTPEPQIADTTVEIDVQETACERWPLPKISYRHRKTAAPRPR